MIRNVLKRRRECGTYLTTARRHLRRLKMQKRDESYVIHLSSASLVCNVYGQQPGRCRTLSSFLIHFLSLYLSRFSFYFNSNIIVLYISISKFLGRSPITAFQMLIFLLYFPGKCFLIYLRSNLNTPFYTGMKAFTVNLWSMA